MRLDYSPRLNGVLPLRAGRTKIPDLPAVRQGIYPDHASGGLSNGWRRFRVIENWSAWFVIGRRSEVLLSRVSPGRSVGGESGRAPVRLMATR